MMWFSDHLYSLLWIFSYINFNILIHAPAKGATASFWLIPDLLVFQSTLLRRERRQSLTAEWIRRLFQSTLPRRERPTNTLVHAQNRSFQSTLPRRERQNDCCKLRQVWTFQSTLPRRERLVWLFERGAEWQFQSTLPRRERQHLLTSFRLQYGYSLFHLTNKI